MKNTTQEYEQRRNRKFPVKEILYRQLNGGRERTKKGEVEARPRVMIMYTEGGKRGREMNLPRKKVVLGE